MLSEESDDADVSAYIRVLTYEEFLLRPEAVAFIAAIGFTLPSEAADPDAYCELTSENEPKVYFPHCDKGDLIKLKNSSIEIYCDLNEPIISVGGRETLCVYRGSKRDTKRRPTKKELLKMYYEKYGVKR